MQLLTNYSIKNYTTNLQARRYEIKKETDRHTLVTNIFFDKHYIIFDIKNVQKSVSNYIRASVYLSTKIEIDVRRKNIVRVFLCLF